MERKSGSERINGNVPRTIKKCPTFVMNVENFFEKLWQRRGLNDDATAFLLKTEPGHF